MLLYGMRAFGLLALLMIGGGYWFGLRFQHSFTIGGWSTGLVLVVFAGWALLACRGVERAAPVVGA